MPGDFDRSPCPGERERERERESESEIQAILAQVLHLCLGTCAALLNGGEDGELTRSCASGGAFPFDPVVLELHIRRHFA